MKKKGIEKAAKKSERETHQGRVFSYVHGGKIGVLVSLLCETDFVAKNPEFKAVAYDIAMHVAAMNPTDVGELLDQPFIKDSSKKIGDLVNGAVQKFGERTEIGRFVRLAID